MTTFFLGSLADRYGRHRTMEVAPHEPHTFERRFLLIGCWNEAPYEFPGSSQLVLGRKRRVRGELISSNTIPVLNQLNPGSDPSLL